MIKNTIGEVIRELHKNLDELPAYFKHVGNTAVEVYPAQGHGPVGTFVQDGADLSRHSPMHSRNYMVSQLGSHEENGVIFSDDRSIRYTPHSQGLHTSITNVERNPEVIAWVGGLENAALLAELVRKTENTDMIWFGSPKSGVVVPRISRVGTGIQPRIGLAYTNPSNAYFHAKFGSELW